MATTLNDARKLKTQSASVSKRLLWPGYVVSALPALFLLLDGITKLVKPPIVLEAQARIGYPESTILGLGIVQLVCTVLYLIPRTAVLGAILLTGYLGGAVAAHVRINDMPVLIILPALLGALLWGGLYLRDERLRSLIPWRS